MTGEREAPPLWLTVAQLAGIAAVIAIVIASGTWKALLVAFWLLPLIFAISNARRRGRN